MVLRIPVRVGQHTPERLLAYVGLAILAFLFVWFQLQLLLLAFAGVLVAVILRSVTLFIERHTRLNGMFAYAATLFLIGAILAGLGFLLAPRIETQISDLMHSLPESIHRLEVPLNRSETGHELLVRGRQAMQSSHFGAHLPQIATAVSDSVTDVIIVVVIGFFGALNPRWYEEGLLALLPEPARGCWRAIVTDLQRQLRWWLLGQLLPMVVLGVGSGIGLSCCTCIWHGHSAW